jgi:hypothetical protein
MPVPIWKCFGSDEVHGCLARSEAELVILHQARDALREPVYISGAADHPAPVAGQLGKTTEIGNEKSAATGHGFKRRKGRILMAQGR